MYKVHTTDSITICQIFKAIQKITLQIWHVQEKVRELFPNCVQRLSLGKTLPRTTIYNPFLTSNIYWLWKWRNKTWIHGDILWTNLPISIMHSLHHFLRRERRHNSSQFRDVTNRNYSNTNNLTASAREWEWTRLESIDRRSNTPFFLDI